MTNPRILVTGATGKTGSLVVAELLKAGYPVRAMVHREDARSGRLKTLGADLVVYQGRPDERHADRSALAARACERRFLDVVNWNSEGRGPCWNNSPFS